MVTLGVCLFPGRLGSVPGVPHLTLAIFPSLVSVLLGMVGMLLTLGHLGPNLFPLPGFVAGIPALAVHYPEGKHMLCFMN